MRNSLLVRLLAGFCVFTATLLFLLICIFPSIIILELIRNPIFIAVLILELFWLISIARKYIQPLNILHKNLETPSNLSTAFYITRNIPIEIRKIFSSLIDLLASNQEDINTFLSDKKMFTSVLRNMNDGILIANEEGIITLINQSARLIFNIPGEHAVGSTLVEVLRVHQMNELFEKCTTTKQQQMASFETHADRKYIQCIATPLDPELPGNILFLFQDLTRMRQLEIIRQDFVSNVSHELRTPLASVKLIAETLQESALDDPPAARKFLKSMDSEVDNLIQLVEELLELSKIESGRVPLEKQWTHPIDIIKTAGDRMVLQANRAGLQFSYFADGNLPRIFIDGARLEQVLVNLMHNAIKFTKPGGSIEASAYRDKENIVFYVRDSGIGIPQKDLERIFERFYKTDRSRSERGTGLGLSISRHLVESHSGKIWAESKPGTSSTFYFSIPIS